MTSTLPRRDEPGRAGVHRRHAPDNVLGLVEPGVQELVEHAELEQLVVRVLGDEQEVLVVAPRIDDDAAVEVEDREVPFAVGEGHAEGRADLAFVEADPVPRRSAARRSNRGCAR